MKVWENKRCFCNTSYRWIFQQQFSVLTMYFNLYLNRNMAVRIWKLQHNQTCRKTLPAVAVCWNLCTITVNLTVQLTTWIRKTLSHLWHLTLIHAVVACFISKQYSDFMVYIYLSLVAWILQEKCIKLVVIGIQYIN